MLDEKLINIMMKNKLKKIDNELKEHGEVIKKNNKFGYIFEDKEIISCKYDWLDKPYKDKFIAVLDGTVGLMDKEEKIIIPFGQYEDIYNFSNDRAIIIDSGVFGFIDSNGEEIIPAVYDYAWAFIESFTIVKTWDMYNLIDLQGNLISDIRHNSKDIIEDYMTLKILNRYKDKH